MDFNNSPDHILLIKTLVKDKISHWLVEIDALGEEIGDYTTALQVYSSAGATLVAMLEEVVQKQGGTLSRVVVGPLKDSGERN